MEVLGYGLQAIGEAIGSWAIAYAMIYCVAIGCKTFLIYSGEANPEELKNWLDFKIWKEKNKGL